MTSEEKAGIFGFFLLLLIVGFIFCNPLAIVGVGERGVKVTLGKVSPQSYTEGVHFVTPFLFGDLFFFTLCTTAFFRKTLGSQQN